MAGLGSVVKLGIYPVCESSSVKVVGSTPDTKIVDDLEADLEDVLEESLGEGPTEGLWDASDADDEGDRSLDFFHGEE